MGGSRIGQLTFSSASNTYSGGTVIGDSTTSTGSNRIRLTVNAGSSLGSSGTVNVLANGQLTLNSSSNLTSEHSLWLDNDLSTLGVINLNYEGTNIISALSFDGGLTFAAAGTYGSFASSAGFQSAFFSGLGTLTVIPEPGTASLLAGALMAGVLMWGKGRIRHRDTKAPRQRRGLQAAIGKRFFGS